MKLLGRSLLSPAPDYANEALANDQAIAREESSRGARLLDVWLKVQNGHRQYFIWAGKNGANCRSELPPDAEPKIATNVPPTALAGITGRYDMGDGMTLVVTNESGHIFAEITGRKKFELLPESDRTFFVNSGQAVATFVRNTNDQVVKVILRQAGDRIDAPKLAP